MARLRDRLSNTEQIKLDIYLNKLNSANFPWVVLYWEMRCHILLSKVKRRIRLEESVKKQTNSIKGENQNVIPVDYSELEKKLKEARKMIEEGEKIIEEAKNRIVH